MPRRELNVRATREGSVARVALGGELDIATAPLLEAALEDAERRRPRAVLIDLGEVEFMDSSGLRSLLLARRRADSAGRALRIANVQPRVAKVLDVTGVRRLLDIAAPA